MFEIERLKIGHSLHKGTETFVRDRGKFEIEGVRDRKSQLYDLSFEYGAISGKYLNPRLIRASK